MILDIWINLDNSKTFLNHKNQKRANKKYRVTNILISGTKIILKYDCKQHKKQGNTSKEMYMDIS